MELRLTLVRGHLECGQTGLEGPCGLGRSERRTDWVTRGGGLPIVQGSSTRGTSDWDQIKASLEGAPVWNSPYLGLIGAWFLVRRR